jgi:hypothetical protein
VDHPAILTLRVSRCAGEDTTYWECRFLRSVRRFCPAGETAGAPKANDEDFRLLEAKIRQAWEDYKKQEQRSLQTHFYRGRN